MNNQKRDMFVIGFALFSMFFGAGNVIFPPYLGVGAGSEWILAFICYYTADIGLALVAIFAMLKCDSDIEGITKRIGKVPSLLISSAIVLCVGPLLAIPRTAATTFEMTMTPIFGTKNPLIFTILFFVLILVLCIKESSVVDIVGKILTPALFIGLIVLIVKGIISPIGNIAAESKFEKIVVSGITSGYQTMDVLAALVFGVIVVKTVADKGYTKHNEKVSVIGGAGIIAGIGLLIVYGGLAYLGATASSIYDISMNRATLVIEIVKAIFGNVGTIIFGIVVALACITTAIALVSSSASYFSEITDGKIKYKNVVVIVCIFSAIVSNVGLDAIISISTPILNIVYPAALTLIALSLVGDKIKNDNIFKFATFGALVASIVETLSSYNIATRLADMLPFSEIGFGWVVPAVIFGIIGYFIKSKNNRDGKSNSGQQEVEEALKLKKVVD